MPRIETRSLSKLTFVILCTTALLTSAFAEDDLKTIDNPGGGQIVYGPVTGQT